RRQEVREGGSRPPHPPGGDSWIARLADRLAWLALSHRRAVFLTAFVVAVLAGLAASRLRFDPDLLSLVPQDNKVVNDFRRVLTDMGTIDYHLVVVEVPKGRDAAEYEPLIDALGAGYRALPEVRGVLYRLPEPVSLIEQVLPRAFLLLTPAELDRVGRALTDAQIEATVARNRQLLLSPAGSAATGLVRYDPFDLLPIFLERFRQAGAGLKLATGSGYYLSADRTTFLLAVRPRRPAQDIPFARQLTDAGERLERRALADFHRDSPEVPLPRIGHTGGYAISLYDAELIRQDVLVNILFSCVAVLALFLYAFGRPAALAYAGLPLVLAILVTFGVAGLAFGKLSSSSAAFAALVAGLGVDFVTVLYGRYVDERRRGVELPVALSSVLRTTLGGVLIAAGTTAATFYAYLATEFRGLSQLGFLTATGILVFFISILFLLPALLVSTERPGERGGGAGLVMRSFGSERAVRLALSRPRATIVAWVVLVLLWALCATRLTFNDSVENLRAKGNAGVALQQRVTRRFGQSFGFMMLAIEGRDLEETLARTTQAAARLDPLVERGAIASYQSISTFLPPPSQQRQVIALLRAGQADRFNAPRIAGALRGALARNGFRPDIYDSYLALFARALNPQAPVGPEAFDGPLADLAHRFLERTRNGYMSVIYLYPPSGAWPRTVPPALLAAGRAEPRATLTGINLVSETLRGIVRADATRATLLGFLIVFVIFWVSYRKVARAALLFVPFLAGATGMLGLMALCRLEFNFVNVYVGLFLVGVATDYAVYVLQRFLEAPDRFAAGAPETGKAVAMAALTAIAGFGSFALSHYPGLRSIGYASTFGVGLSALASITLLPAILTLGQKRGSPPERP
ncbi:MAG TPA: MMPL family transporter, partial [Thermoanaerobaculia bacterium]|nr:MMPL family transporter [Thermoanaerobaculia bacterium]